MAFRHQFLFLLFGLTVGVLTAIVLDAFLGSFLLASFSRVDRIAQDRSEYTARFEELRGSGVATVDPVHRVLLERQNNLWVMGVICLAGALLATSLVGFLVFVLFHYENDRLVVQSVFWLNLIVVSGLYRFFPLSQTPLGESLAKFLARLWIGIWGAG
ncbi:hypothetical protein COT52_01055 [candidate division WWE3 bacterium CG08_land_8_20_14_0_20_43_13]|uniref:Uncharacterized protein n=2 Tax=Bacteria candidate phyla TaxID=1783234 RepID=A0A2H0X7Q0_UNCKA|nr:MAG: hypothetical protein COT52_01055 [candidate division WWE3 bacterium CG08_land_8_20_14_0_20_43_13]PIV10341.1 MAG: hypothetical protein COS49_01015 [Candidatus Portnoybacteria bacterium CG03_land_8_20_14_0_80_41_10]